MLFSSSPQKMFEGRFYQLGFSAESAEPNLNTKFRALNWIKLSLTDHKTLNEIGKTGPEIDGCPRCDDFVDAW